MPRLSLITALVAVFIESAVVAAPDTWVFFGCIDKSAPGIYRATFDSSSGELGTTERVYEGNGMSFLAIAADGEHLYSVESVEGSDGKPTGGVSFFSLDAKTGAIRQEGTSLIESRCACHLALTPDGKTLATADYGEGKVASFAVGSDGMLSAAKAVITHEGSSIDKKRQMAPHAHCVIPSLDSRFFYSADLGTDSVYCHAVRADSSIAPNAAFSGVKVKNLGGGPRHFAIHPNGKFAYTNLELTSQVTAFQLDGATGALTEDATVSTLPAGFSEKTSTSELLVHPSGKFLFCANHGHNSIATLSIDEATGALSSLKNEPCGGDIPRNFGITPDGGWIVTANQNSGNTAVLKLDQTSGQLTLTDAGAELPQPMCVRFLPIAE